MQGIQQQQPSYTDNVKECNAWANMGSFKAQSRCVCRLSQASHSLTAFQSCSQCCRGTWQGAQRPKCPLDIRIFLCPGCCQGKLDVDNNRLLHLLNGLPVRQQGLRVRNTICHGCKNQAIPKCSDADETLHDSVLCIQWPSTHLAQADIRGLHIRQS